MEYLAVKEAGEKWGVWLMPASAYKQEDKRKNNGPLPKNERLNGGREHE